MKDQLFYFFLARDALGFDAVVFFAAGVLFAGVAAFVIFSSA